MKYTFVTICMLFVLSALGQNLLPNASFELHSECPANLDGGFGDYFPVDQWSSARWSPDYFNSCAPSPYYGTPSNLIAYQVPLDGQAHVGFMPYNILGTEDCNELIQAAIPALEPDTEYIATINISCAASIGNANYAVDGFGIYFCTYNYSSASSGSPLVVLPQVDYTHYGIISDTVNWVSLTDTFTADSAYTHVIIGNFKSGAAIHKQLMAGDGSMLRAYYFIDKVSLVKRSQAHSLNVSTAEKAGLTFYPNPARSSLTINSPVPIKTIVITNVFGQPVYTDHTNSGQLQVDISSLPEGVYLIRVNETEARSFLKRSN